MAVAIAMAMTLALALAGGIPVAQATGAANASSAQQAGRAQTGGTSAIPMPEPVSNARITLESQTTFVGTGDSFVMAVALADTTPDSRFSIALHPPVTSRIQFGQTLGAQQLGTPIQRFDGIAVSDLPASAAGASVVSLLVPEPGVAPGPFTLLVTTPGVYPITVTLDDDPSAVPMVTHVVRLGVPDTDRDADSAADAPVDPAFSVGMLFDINEPGGIDGLTAALAAHPGIPVTLRASPEPLGALAASGPQGAAVVQGLAAVITDSEVLTNTWVPVDMASLVAARLDQFIDRQVLTGTSTLQQLLGIDVSERTWVIDDSVDPDALGALVTRGVRQVVIPEQLAESLDTSRFPVTLTRPFAVPIATDSGQADDNQADSDQVLIPAMQTDLVLAALLESSPQPAMSANRVLADLAVLAFDLADVPRGAIVDTAVGDVPGETIATVLSGLRDASRRSDTIEPLMQARTVGDLFTTSVTVGELNGEGPLVRTWDFDEPQSLGAFPEQLAAVDDRTATLIGTVLPGPGAPAANTTVDAVNALVLASGRRSLDTAERTERLDQADLAIDQALAPIGIPEQGSVTLTADAGVIPVTIQNGRSDPVRVRLELTSDKLDFPDGDTLELVLDPGTNRREVSVRVRASGGFPVEIRLSTPDDSIQLGQGRFTVRSTAISGTGLVLSVLAGVFLAAWWALHFRSARRSRQLMAIDNPDGGVAGQSDPAEPPDPPDPPEPPEPARAPMP